MLVVCPLNTADAPCLGILVVGGSFPGSGTRSGEETQTMPSLQAWHFEGQIWDSVLS